MGCVIEFPLKTEIWKHPAYPNGWVVIEHRHNVAVHIVIEIVGDQLKIMSICLCSNRSLVDVNVNNLIIKDVLLKWYRKIQNMEQTLIELAKNAKVYPIE